MTVTAAESAVAGAVYMALAGDPLELGQKYQYLLN